MEVAKMSEMDIDHADSIVDPQLWQICAGSTIRMPRVNSQVFYFPQGHIEQLYGGVDLDYFPSIPHMIYCRAEEINYLADRESDEIYAKFRLVPVSSSEPDHADQDDGQSERSPKVVMKILTRSDANNGGGFSVPKECAGNIFPSLNYKADPPVQDIYPRDVHGERWKIKHIYRGNPLRHLLTTGWSEFVTAKNLIVDDSVLFVKGENGGIRVLIRRPISKCIEWNPKSFYVRCCEERAPKGGKSCEGEANGGESCEGEANGGNPSQRGGNGGKPVRSLSRFPEKETADSVTQAALSAANGQPFEVIYYPRQDAAEFVVKAELVNSASQVCWSRGTRVKILHEKEGELLMTWFTGTVSALATSNASKWPESPWKALKVEWDHDPYVLKDLKHVSPWLVKLESSVAPQPKPSKMIIKPAKVGELQGARLEVNRHLRMLTIPANVKQATKPSGNLPVNRPAGVEGARPSRLLLSNLNPERRSTLQSGGTSVAHSTGDPAATVPTRSSNPSDIVPDPHTRGTASPAETVRSSDPAATTVQDPCSNDIASHDAAIRSSSPTSSNSQDPSSNGYGSGRVSRPPGFLAKQSGHVPENDSHSSVEKNSDSSQQVRSSPENDSDSDDAAEKSSDDNQQVPSSPEAGELGSKEVIPIYHVMKREMQLFVEVPREMDLDMEPSAP
ncbi:Auxin response factor 16-like protein [Drosera capensis]